jgi:NADPH-dependent 2,4-dienoyl-CoA reductase/sulfur reductase-like enzyme
VSTSRRVIVVGGDAAGMSAASRIARRAPDSRVTVLERSTHVSYAACGMPYHLDDRIPDAGALLVRPPEHFAALGVDLRVGHEVTGLDPDAGAVTVRSGRTERTERYDALLIATGAVAVVPPVAGTDASGVHLFRSYDDLLDLRRRLDRERPGRIVVVGGGYIGVELAEVLTEAGVAVTLVEAGPRLMLDVLDPESAETVAAELARHGVDLRLGMPLGAVDTRDGRVRGVRTAGGDLACDAVVLAVGVRAATAFTAGSGLELDPASGAVVVGEDMRTVRDGVWAAGDCATSTDLVTGRRTWVPLGPTANKQGRVAADAILGRDARFPGVVGTALVRVFDLEVGRTGLTAAQAARSGFDVVTERIEAPDRAHYYPGARPTVVTLHGDRHTGRLLGGQVLGRSGVAGRTNVLATALQAGLTVEQLGELDLGYAPQFAPVWDPVLVAAHRLEGRLARPWPAERETA